MILLLFLLSYHYINLLYLHNLILTYKNPVSMSKKRGSYHSDGLLFFVITVIDTAMFLEETQSTIQLVLNYSISALTVFSITIGFPAATRFFPAACAILFTILYSTLQNLSMSIFAGFSEGSKPSRTT